MTQLSGTIIQQVWSYAWHELQVYS